MCLISLLGCGRKGIDGRCVDLTIMFAMSVPRLGASYIFID